MNNRFHKAALPTSVSNRSSMLVHDASENLMMPLGCSGCPHQDLCGGLNIKANIWNCADFCCGTPNDCDRVCRNNSLFATQYNEVGGFDLEQIGQVENSAFLPSSRIVPAVYHASRRTSALSSSTVSVRLADLYNFRTGEVRFRTRDELAQSFLISPDAEIILCGIDHDRRVEPWWGLCQENRTRTIDQLMELSIDHVMTPNFSVMLNRPRTDDLHSMMRIAIVYEELVARGMSTSLHVNGRTDRDFERWGHFLRNRPGINQVAFEFSTGPGRKNRLALFLTWLENMASIAGRPLDIFVRGNPNCLPALRCIFDRVIYIETTSFMKTTKRKIAERRGNDRLTWTHYPTARGAPLNMLFEHNAQEQAAWLTAQFYRNAA